MTDYLLKFDSIEDFNLPKGDGPCWVVEGKTIMPVKVVTQEPVYGMSEDGSPTVITPRLEDAHYWVVVSAGEFNHPNLIDWSNVPGRVEPEFVGRIFSE